MEKTYAPNEIEEALYKFWEDNSHFKPSGTGKPFSIVMPPPNVTGALHIGHALDHTLQDAITRYKRMTGHNTLWLPGTDHAGIATQNVVEKQLKKQEKKSRHDLGREKFVEKVWEWKAEYGDKITTQIRRLGDSVDWSRQRFTMDEDCQEAVLDHFINLYKEGLIYRGKRIINWCPRCRTALSDVEVEHVEKSGHLWHIKYQAQDGTELIVATTRPETLLGDTAVAVHPEDKRYSHLIGKTLKVPMSNREIPIVADSHVDPEFGTGAVKVTPAHDPNDYEIGERHNLEKIIIMDEAAKLNENTPEKYCGMDRYDARKQLLEDLDAQSLLIKIEDHTHSVAHCYRCNTVLEPYLSPQWFVDMKTLAGPAIDAIKTKSIEIIPARWEKLYFDWMENIRDWCISRQIWWGHQIPVYYKNDNPEEFIVSKTPPEDIENYTQDPDVLDTWFSSALWPFSTMGWPNQTDDLSKFYPGSLLVTGYDILTFWVSRMITMGLHEMKEIPFEKVYIHGLVRDIQGRKMSKSLGNAIDPLKIIESHGADALRFALASLATLGGQDIKLGPDKIEASRNFANKVWNSTRYILMNAESTPIEINLDNAPTPASEIGEWIISELYSTIDKVTENFEAYNFAGAADTIRDFIWNKFCDWYIEASKLDAEKALPTLLFVLLNALKLLHPIMPFLTEAIWQKLSDFPNLKITGAEKALIISSWPQKNPNKINPKIESQMTTLFNLIRELRNMRATLGIPPSKENALIAVSDNPNTLALLKNNQALLQKLAQTTNLETHTSLSPPKGAAASVEEGTQLYIPLEGLINIEEEIARLAKQSKKLETDLSLTKKKLDNPKFTQNAPPQLVQEIQEKYHALEADQKLLQAQMISLKS